jgi:hypothetical protein
LIFINNSVLGWVTGAMFLLLFASTLVQGFAPPVRLAKTMVQTHPLQATAENIPTADVAVKTTIQVCGSKDCTRRGGGARLEKTIREVGRVLSRMFCWLRHHLSNH